MLFSFSSPLLMLLLLPWFFFLPILSIVPIFYYLLSSTSRGFVIFSIHKTNFFFSDSSLFIGLTDFHSPWVKLFSLWFLVLFVHYFVWIIVFWLLVVDNGSYFCIFWVTLCEHDILLNGWSYGLTHTNWQFVWYIFFNSIFIFLIYFWICFVM